MGKMSRFLRICAVLSAMFFATNVFAAGYTCNDIKMYTSCNAGYYMSVTDENGEVTPNTTAQVGNACTLCEVGYYCPGGDATTNANARVTCTAGKACTTTGLSAPDATCTAGYYCPSGSSSPTASACPTNWTSDAGAASSKYCYRTATLYKGLSSRGLASGTLTTPTAGSTYYRATVTSDTGGTAAATLRVYYGYNYFPVTTGLTSPTGYTVTGGVGTSATCTTANSSTAYSNYLNVTSTSDTAPTFYVCMKANEYTCAAGQYLTTSATCATCSLGYYCPTEEVTYTYNNAIQGRTACSTIAIGWTSLAGAAGINQCFYPISLNKNGFSGTLTAGTGTGCKVAITATGTTNVTLRLYYNTACTLPTFSGYTQDGYTNSAAWSASNTIAGTPVTTIAATTTTPTTKTYYVQKPSCAQNYYKSDTTTCSACGSNSSTSAGNVATTCACTFGYSDDGTVGGETSATGGCSLINDISCSAGYYLPKNTLTCNGTCTAGNWCAGGTFSFNASSDQGLSSCSGNLGTGYTSVGGTGDTANTKCYLPVSAGYIRSGTNGTTTAACDAGKYKTAHNAYYGSSYSCSNVTAGYWNNGGGTNATGGVISGKSGGTIAAGRWGAAGATSDQGSGAVSAGYYSTGGGTSATPTAAGNGCLSSKACGKVTAGCYTTSTGSTTACPNSCSSLGGGLYKNSAAGSDAETDCYFATTAGNYMVAATDTAQTKCPIKQYCESETLYYPNVSVLNDGGWNDCPAVDGRILTTYPDDWYSPTSVTASLQPWSTGLTSKSACMANYTVTNPRGRFSIESVKYDEDANKYQNNLTGGKYYTKVNPGFYVLEQYSATRCDGTENANKTMIYKDAQPCPAGSYCPGYTSMPICSSGTYGTEMGKFSCSDNTSSNYPNSTAGSGNTAGATSVNSCYLTTTSGKFVKTANAAQETCTCGGYCPGSIKVNYGSTGGKTDCAAGTYNDGTGSSASSVCKTTSAGYYALAGSCSQTQVDANCWGGAGSKVACPNSCTSPYSTSAKGSDDANDCYLTTTAKNYVKTAGAGQTTCAAGTYCPGGSVIYKGGTVSGRNTTGGSTTCPAGSFCAAGVSAGTECVLGSYSAAGASACTACQDGKTTSAKGATSCNATCSNASGVSDWETASWATTNVMTNLCTIAASAGCSANYYKNNNACSTCSSGTGSKYTFSAAGTTSVNSCYLKTSTGKYVATKGAGETACISPYYCPGGTTVYYGTGTTTGGNSPCTGIASIYNASDAGASKQSQCFAKTSPGKYIKATGTSETTCPAGDYCLGSTTVYYGSAGGNTDCPSGYTNGTTGYSLESQCLMSVAGGKYVATAKESVASGTCEAGYAKPTHTVNYGGTSSCNKCTGATYQDATGQESCEPCPEAEAYPGSTLGYYWDATGLHTTDKGCNATITNPTISNGTLSKTTCYLDENGDYGTANALRGSWGCEAKTTNLTCDGGYYTTKSGQYAYPSLAELAANTCTSVGSGYYSADGDLTRTACDTGLVTCGAGKCANEAADCGRILHAGNQSIYLRSVARTSPALNVKIGNQTFFGALSTSYSSALKVKNDGTTYSVVNDYQ